jgi:hypothetical protein
MRTRFLFLASLLVPAALARPAAAADETPAKPTLVVRVSSLDSLVADARFVVTAAGRDDVAEQIEGLLKSKTGPSGLEGIDTKRPLGLYGQLSPKLADSQAVLLLPIADEKAFLDMLNRLDFPPEKAEGGTYKVSLPKVPKPVHFRFANKYLYAALNPDAIAKDKLLEPDTVLPAERVGTVSATVNLDQVPANLKDLTLTSLEMNLANEKAKKQPKETETQRALRATVLDEIAAQYKALLDGGGELDARLDVDRKAGELALAVSLAGKPGSKLATSIADLGSGPSVGAALPAASTAVRAAFNVAVPASVRKAFASVVDEEIQKGLKKEADPDRRKALEGLFQALGPTLKSGELDAGFDVRGPEAGGKVYTMVSAVRLKDGADVEKSLRAVVKALPEGAEGFLGLKFDAEKAGAVAVHRLNPPNRDEGAKRLFGEEPFYFAFRDDALFLAAGKDGLAAIKAAAAAAPKAGTAFRAEVALAALAPLLAQQHKAAPEAAKESFKEAGSDRVVVTLEGGKALRLRATMKAPVVGFFGRIQKAEKAE